MKRPPTPRPRIYDLYWYYASERQRMFERRLTGEPGPWTSDPILREFKFCNVFRAADRVSQYMIRDVCYHGEPCTDEDRLFQITSFRTFSKTATWATVRDILGRYPTLDDLAEGSFGRALDTARQRNGGLYTGAFILCATDAYGQSSTYGRDESMPCFASTSVPGSGAYSAAARQVGQPGEQRRLVTVHARRLIE